MAHHVIFVTEREAEMTHYVRVAGNLFHACASFRFGLFCCTGDEEVYSGWSGVCGCTLSDRVLEAEALLVPVLRSEEGRRLVLLGCSGGASVADALCAVRNIFSLIVVLSVIVFMLQVFPRVSRLVVDSGVPSGYPPHPVRTVVVAHRHEKYFSGCVSIRTSRPPPPP